MTIRAACYLRISKDTEGDSLGVQRQLDACRHLAAAKGWELDEDWVLDENDTSASTGKTRPQFEKLLRGMESGEVVAVVSYKVDRLMRRMDDMVRLWNIARRRNVLVATVAGDLDLTTPSGRSNAMLWGVIAAIEIDNLTDRLQRKALQSVQAGKNANGGSRPFGWDVKRMKHHPVEKDVLLDLAARVIAGESLTSLARDLNRQRIPTPGWRDRAAKAKENGEPEPRWIRWDSRKVKVVLSNERHAGRVSHHGKVVTDEHGLPVTALWEPILPPDEFDRVQAAIDGRSVTNDGWTSQRRHLLSGTIMRCSECGEKLLAFQQTGGKTSYRCRGHLSRNRDRTDEFVLSQVRGYISEHPFRVSSWSVVHDSSLNDEIVRLERQLVGMEDAFVTSGGDPARLARMTSALDVRLSALRAQREHRMVTHTGQSLATYDVNDLLDVSASLMDNDDPEKPEKIEAQRRVIQLYTTSITVSPSKVRGRFFDESTIKIEFRDPALYDTKGTVDPETGYVEIRGTYKAAASDR